MGVARTPDQHDLILYVGGLLCLKYERTLKNNYSNVAILSAK